jgi:hypothetical protein
MGLPFLLALLGFVLSVCVSGSAFAAPVQQDPAATNPSAAAAARQHVADPQRQLAQLARKLALSPQQSAAIGPILERGAQQVQQLRADNSMDPRSRRNRLRALKQSSERQLQRHAGQAPGGGGASRP